MKISLIGIGLGNIELLTIAGKREIEQADIIIGAMRMLESITCLSVGKRCISTYKSEEIYAHIQMANAENEAVRIAIVFSGDICFFSGAKQIYEMITKAIEEKSLDAELVLYNGISSFNYMCMRAMLPMAEVYATSIHGRMANIVQALRTHRYLFTLTSGGESVKQELETLVSYGLGEVFVYIGENLSYSDEIFKKCTIKEGCTHHFGTMVSLLFVNEAYKTPYAGIDNGYFIREKVPMTKAEVRAIVMSKLRVQKTSLCYDIGAGTGSVSIEMAQIATDGRIVAIEKKEEACTLIKKNKEKFGLQNIDILHVLAPAGLEGIEEADCIFIGGSSGNMREIIDGILSKSKKSPRIVITAITLESIVEISEALAYARGKGKETDISYISVTKGECIGRYTMMQANNPVVIAVIA